jgi:hypothetical protein
MKKALILICIGVLTSSIVHAQAPQSFSYQSIARKTTGVPLTNTVIGLRIGIRDLTSTGSVVYLETQTATTNAFGLFTISIGSGTVVSGSFADVKWDLGAKFIEVEADFDGGANYGSMGTSQLLSVPYALYSQNGTPGPIGPQGPAGLPGPTGPQGLPGAQGATGPAGTAGAQGAIGLGILSGNTDPDVSTGSNGEFYINTTTHTLFGPKAGGAWPTGVFLVGPAGPAGNDGAQGPQGIQGQQGLPGAAGSNGLSILNGTVDPANGTGADGEFYINTAASTLFGPKASGVWPAGVSLAGPQGPAGSLAPGTAAGNTSYWDGSSWIDSDNIFNDGSRVGIGTTSPEAKLDVVGTIKITDGTEGAGKILTSGATGLATWSPPSLLNPCYQCEVNYTNCLAGAGGDPDVTAVCYDEYLTCRNSCDVPGLQRAIKIEAFPRNSVFGYNAAVGGALTNATAIGANAVVTVSNAIQLGNVETTQIFAGTNNTATVITGGLKVTGGSPGAGKVLTSDANGVATWQAASGVNTAGGPFTVMMGSDQAARIEAQVIVGTANTFFGHRSGNTNGGSNNTAVGVEALFSNNGGFNVGYGSSALRSNLTGDFNTAIGSSALFSNRAGSNATAVGYRAMAFANDQVSAYLNNNVALGYEALLGSTTASANTGISNTAIGYRSLTSNTFGSLNTAVGMGSLLNNSTGNYNTAVGGTALTENTAGNENTATGFFSLISNLTGNGNVANGTYTLALNSAGNINTAQGNYALGSNTTGSGSTAVGNYALFSSNGSSNTGIGSNALYTNTDGTNNTGIGYGADVGSGSLSNATAIGNGAIVSETNAIQLGNSSVTKVLAGTGSNATLVAGGLQITGGSPGEGKVLTSNATGVATWQAAAGGSGWGLTANAGTIDGTNYIGTTDDVPLSFMVNGFKSGRIDHLNSNTFFGYRSGLSNTGGGSNSAYGRGTMQFNTTGNFNVASGVFALSANTSGNQNVAVGFSSLTNNTTGSENTAMGVNSMLDNTTGSSNTASGRQALNGNQTGNFNTAHGQNSLATNNAGSGGTAIGYGAMMFANNTATPFTNFNVAVGYEALKGSGSPAANVGNSNTVVGYQALLENTTGSSNAANGYQALFSNTTGGLNSVNGAQALYSNTTGASNTASGFQALANNTGGTGNSAYGREALRANTTGSNNVAIGLHSGYTGNPGNANTTGSNNTFVGDYSGPGTPTQLTNASAFGYGAVVSASNSIQFGNTSVTEAALGNSNSSILKVGEIRIGSGEYNYSSAKPRNLTLGNAAFVAAGPDGMTASRNVTTVAGIPVSVYTVNGPASPAVSSFTAQVNLPDGAIVTDLTAYVFDTNATYDLNVILTRQAVGTMTINNMASVTSTGAPSVATYSTSSISNGTIDNSGYSYQVVFQSLANGGHAVFNVKISYTVGRAD